MAAPSYTEDLTDIDLAESGSTGWTAFNISGGGGGAPAFGADFGMQGAGCWDKAASNAERGLAVNKTPGTGTVAAGVHIFVWGFNATPGVCTSLATRGAYIIIGTGISDFVQFHVEGSDTYGASGRVAKCYPVDYVTTANTGSIPYRTVTGTPGATPTYFGFGLNTNATVKGSNMGCDAIRYGTGAYITAGESGNPATFAGFQAQNDNINNRWGILTLVGGSYELQGRFVIGQNNSGTPTLAYFDDSDKAIVIVDTPHSEATFTQIIVDHASTTCILTNINIQAAGTHNPGRFVVNNASSTVTITGGTWTDIGITTLRAGCTVDGLTWRTTDAITLNDADVQNCLIDKNTATSAMVTTPSNMTGNVVDNEFISDGTGHAINLGSVASSTSFTWKNTLSGYVAGTTGDPVTTGTSGNEAILCNVASGQKLTINVATGYTVPSVKNDGSGTVAVVSAGVTIDVNVKDQAGANVQSALVYIDDDLGVAGNITNTTTDASGNITQATYNGAETTATLRVRKYGYKPFVSTITLLSNTATNVTLITDPQQT
jgi:hypothetical protein